MYWLVANRNPIVPELMSERDLNFFRKDRSYKSAQQALEYVEKAISVLEEKIVKIHSEEDDQMSEEMDSNSNFDNLPAQPDGETESLLIYHKRKYYYALNQFVFFTTQAGTKEEFLSKKTEDYFEDFDRGNANPVHWQPRYYDTVARYYLRRALLAETEDQFLKFLKLAERNNDESIQVSKRKEEFDKWLKDKIIKIGAEGFDKWSS